MTTIRQSAPANHYVGRRRATSVKTTYRIEGALIALSGLLFLIATVLVIQLAEPVTGSGRVSTSFATPEPTPDPSGWTFPKGMPNHG